MKSHNTYHKALIALGANDALEAPLMVERLQNALLEMACEKLRVVEVSRFYESPCFPAGIGNDFVNAVALLEVNMTPNDLLQHLHNVEDKSGRIRILRWGTRPLDLDLLAVEKNIIPDAETYNHWRNLSLSTQMERAPDEIILPHPRITDRGFVLLPLRDVAPDWVHPVSGETVDELIGALPPEAIDGVVPIDL